MKTPINNDHLKQLFDKAKADQQGFDDFEKDALAGFDMLGSEKEAGELKTALDERINKELFTKEKNNTKVYWLAAAGLALVVGLSTLFVLNDTNSKSNGLAITNTAQENSPVFPDSKKELKEQTTATSQFETTPSSKVSIEGATEKQNAEPERSTNKQAKIATELAKNLEDQLAVKKEISGNEMGWDESKSNADGKKVTDEEAKKSVKKDDGITKRMILPVTVVNSQGPKDIPGSEKDKSERRKEGNKDGENINTRGDQVAGLDDLAKTPNTKDKGDSNFKSEIATGSAADLKLAETETVKKDRSNKGTAKQKAKNEEKNADADAESLDQSVAFNTTNSNGAVNREENPNKSTKKSAAKTNKAVDNSPGQVAAGVPFSENAVSANQVNAVPAEVTTKDADLNNCYYLGGETAITSDLKTKLMTQNLDQKFDATLYINEKKMVDKVEFINAYALTKNQKEEVTRILKTLSKFNFVVSPSKKGNVPYKLLYRP